MDIAGDIRVQSEPFETTAEINQLRQAAGDVGAIVTFSGVCRDEDGTLAALELEHYPGMAEAQLRRIAEDAAGRWPLSGLTVIHRHGRLEPGDDIVLVITCSKHRAAAFEAARYIMDFLKTDAPFWKKEHRVADQSGTWVKAAAADDTAAEGWKPADQPTSSTPENQ